MLTRLALILALSAVSHAQIDEDGDVLTAHDNRGNIATVYNRFDGASYSLQVSRLTAQGYRIWDYIHTDGYPEKAYAVAMDYSGNLFIVGMRNVNRQRRFLALKYNENGYLAWERDDANYNFNCTATSVATDRQGDVVVAGVCGNGSTYPTRVVKYNNDGGFLWSREYDGGGRNYLRSLQVDYAGNISIMVESVYGNYRDGSYSARTVVFSPYGQQLEIR